MNQNYSIFVSMALVAATLIICGKNIDFLLYTILGRIIIVLYIIGLTIFNKYVGIIATIVVTTLYNVNYYKEGLTSNGAENDNEQQSSTENTSNTIPSPSGSDMSSSSATISDEERKKMVVKHDHEQAEEGQDDQDNIEQSHN